MKCVKIDGHEKTWEAADGLCKSQGANLLSINSPKDQEVSELFALFPEALGKKLIRKQRFFNTSILAQF